MSIFIHFGKLQRHIDVLLEERRIVYSLKEELGAYEHTSVTENHESDAFLRNQLRILQNEYDNIQNRITFLKKIIDSFGKLSNETSEELRKNVNQLLKGSMN